MCLAACFLLLVVPPPCVLCIVYCALFLVSLFVIRVPFFLSVVNCSLRVVGSRFLLFLVPCFLRFVSWVLIRLSRFVFLVSCDLFLAYRFLCLVS